ncbi:DUF6348 family protein [Haliscomenobacter sp.]|uniref:DUF6348 family protein n=1 Tax=Haliscomenobacter sp. TaxID=2717303 RepID=UPI003BABD5B8
MGLFDFFKKKSSDSNQGKKQELTTPVDLNSYLIETLKNRLIQLEYNVEKHPQYLALLVDHEIEIATAIIDNPNNHPSVLQLMVLTIQSKYFPNGIEEQIAGIGATIKDKVNHVIDNYIYTTFLTLMDSFSETHNPNLDFYTTNGKEILWHPKLGNLVLQGQWDEEPQNEPFFEIVKDKIKNKLTSNKFNWLKLYIAKLADGTIIGECTFNNEPWEEGLNDITEYAESWEAKSSFQALKQLIVFRRCDAYDE